MKYIKFSFLEVRNLPLESPSSSDLKGVREQKDPGGRRGSKRVNCGGRRSRKKKKRNRRRRCRRGRRRGGNNNNNNGGGGGGGGGGRGGGGGGPRRSQRSLKRMAGFH
ncbi:hypothetical protein HWI79_3192 [Cryptosporidium felis]|nr:hypothetical protein HWI79_3192 [Cryptosporidium felis]